MGTLFFMYRNKRERMMERILFGVVVGMFVGASAVEIVKRTKPELTKEVEKEAKNAVDALVAAFKKGWGARTTKQNRWNLSSHRFSPLLNCPVLTT
jgi:hypothetical protein